jgi:hypothetical protein
LVPLVTLRVMLLFNTLLLLLLRLWQDCCIPLWLGVDVESKHSVQQPASILRC